MKTISVAVADSDYEAFRRGAKAQQRPIAQLIREAMSFYLEHRLEQRSRLTNVPVLAGHRLLDRLPERHEVWEEIAASRDGDRH